MVSVRRYDVPYQSKTQVGGERAQHRLAQELLLMTQAILEFLEDRCPDIDLGSLTYFRFLYLLNI